MNLTREQLQELEKGEPVAVVVGQTRCVVVREDVYRGGFDDSPWTEEEMSVLASEAADMLGWEGMQDYQDER